MSISFIRSKAIHTSYGAPKSVTDGQSLLVLTGKIEERNEPLVAN